MLFALFAVNFVIFSLRATTLLNLKSESELYDNVCARTTVLRSGPVICLQFDSFLGDRLENGSPYAIGPLSVCPSVLSCL